MDASLPLRLLPALVVAVLVAQRAASVRPRRLGDVVDEVVRVLMVGLVAGRLAWLVVGGPEAWRNALSTAILVRAGVLTGAGVLAALWWVGRHVEHDRPWRAAVAVPATLAGLAAWHAACQVEGLCGGVAVDWGVRLPGRAVPTFPASYVEASVAAVLAVVAWRAVRSGRLATAWWAGAGYAVARVALGSARPALVDHPTVDQWWFGLVAAALAVVATRIEDVVPARRLVGDVVVEVTPGDGPVVVLGHGAGSSGWFLREAFEAPLREAGWRLAAVDLRGHADSALARDVADHDLDRHAADLAEVARTLDAAIVGGVSLGGMAAVRAVASGACDVAAVAAVIPAWTGRRSAGEGPHAAVADEVRADGVAGMVARLEAAEDLPAWIREVVLRDYARHDVDSLAAALVALDGGDAPNLDEVAGLPAPLALVAWPDDPGHPSTVAHEWAGVAPAAAVESTTIAAMQADRSAFGAALVAALHRVGVAPGSRTAA